MTGGKSIRRLYELISKDDLMSAAEFAAGWIIDGMKNFLRYGPFPSQDVAKAILKGDRPSKVFRGVHLDAVNSAITNMDVGTVKHIDLPRRQAMSWSANQEFAWSFAQANITGTVDYGLWTLWELMEVKDGYLLVPRHDDVTDEFEDLVAKVAKRKDKLNMRTNYDEEVWVLKSFDARLVRKEIGDDLAVDWSKENPGEREPFRDE